jgi:hypothetical protein
MNDIDFLRIRREQQVRAYISEGKKAKLDEIIKDLDNLPLNIEGDIDKIVEVIEKLERFKEEEL